MFSRIKRGIKYLLSTEEVDDVKSITNTEYWTQHTVAIHQYSSREESLNYLDWRNNHCLFYEELMPCNGFDGLSILDYGCDPGHDVVGFVEFSKPMCVIGMDISKTAIEEVRKRLEYHTKVPVDLLLIKEGITKLPFETSSIDYIHSSGVLHHTPNMVEILKEFYRILKPTGKVRIMVYNYDSIWLHLYVAYYLRLYKGIDADVSLEEAFKRSTDGRDCPISKCFKKEDFLDIGSNAGFHGKFAGSSISLHEMSLLSFRYQALNDIRLAKEHRDFLKCITFDKYDRPLYQSEVAGINAHFELKK